MGFKLDNFIESLKSGIKYLPVTAKLTLVAVVIGLIIGLFIAIFRYYKIPVISHILTVFITIYQGLPMMVALLIYNLLFSYYIGPFIDFFHLNIDVNKVNNIIVAYFALSLAAITTMSETFRGALNSVEKTQFEAGYSVGLTKFQTFKRIILPQVIPVAIPGLINNLVGVIKGTSFVMAIGVLEVTNASLIPCFKTFSYVEGYLAAAIIYWFFTIILEVILSTIEKKYSKKSIKSEVSYA